MAPPKLSPRGEGAPQAKLAKSYPRKVIRPKRQTRKRSILMTFTHSGEAENARNLPIVAEKTPTPFEKRFS